MSLRRASRRGFTLVELLVVIGIIALLISILLPALSKARKSANTAKCLSTVRQLGMALTMYQNEHRGRGIPYYSLTDELCLWMRQLRGAYSNIDSSRLCPEESDPPPLASPRGSVNYAW